MCSVLLADSTSFVFSCISVDKTGGQALIQPSVTQFAQKSETALFKGPRSRGAPTFHVLTCGLRGSNFRKVFILCSFKHRSMERGHTSKYYHFIRLWSYWVL